MEREDLRLPALGTLGKVEILQKIDKAVTLDKSERAIALCHKYKISCVGYFIIGFLGETNETMRETIDFAKKLNPTYAAFFPATPMPGTRLYLDCEEQGICPKDYWRDFVLGKRSDAIPFVTKNAAEWTQVAYKEFYFRPSYIFRHVRENMFKRHFYSEFFGKAKAAVKRLNMRFDRSFGAGSGSLKAMLKETPKETEVSVS